MVRKRALFETDVRIKRCGSACRKIRVANRGCHGGKDMRNNDMDGCPVVKVGAEIVKVGMGVVKMGAEGTKC